MVPSPIPEAPDLFVGTGEMARRMQSHDWSQTALGAVETWSQSLRTSLSICLMSRFPILIWWGPELVMLYNDAYISILGAKHPQALGQAGQECWSEIWDVIAPMLNGVLVTRQATWSDDQLLLINRNGYIEEAYFTFSYSPILDELGQVGGIFTAVTETTTRVISERRLRMLSQLAANIAEVKTLESACHTAIETLAKAPDDIPFALLYHIVADGTQAHLLGMTGTASTTAASLQHVDLSRLDGWSFAQVIISGQAQLIKDMPSRFESLIGEDWGGASEAIVLPIAQAAQQQQLVALLILGISPRREFDDEYRCFFDLVASNVGTAIANANAYEAERQRAEKLAEIDRAKTIFFSNISHEFRTPLTLMLSPLEELAASLDARLQSDERDQFQMVQRNGSRLQKLVNTLLDFSRIEAGRVQAIYAPTDLATYTTELASAFRSLVDQAGLALIVDCAPLPEAIYVDRSLWEKIVLNLLSNAFKFTLTGSITVRLQWQQATVELSVIDTGLGIPNADLSCLFERFYRVESIQGRSLEGSGIGLSLVQELVKLHHGTIHVTSQVGQGSCFTVSIPTGFNHLPTEQIGVSRTISTTLGALSYVEEAQRWLPEESQQLDEWVSQRGDEYLSSRLLDSCSRFRILLVDDNADMRDYIRRLLGSVYEVEAVGDGLAALNLIQTNPPDLVLTDVMMPVMDGFELLRSLRTDPQTQEMPIILLSARAGEESRIEGLAAGADDYLIKPFSARELIARVEATLKLAQLRRTAQEREQLLQSETEIARANLDQILSGLREGFLTFDRDWRYTYINDRQLEIIGMTREAVMGKNVWEVFPTAVNTEIYHQFHRAMDEQVAVQFEVYFPPLKGWFSHRVSPTVEGIAVFVVDISDRVELEAERQQAEDLMRESEERYRALTELSPQLVFMCQPEGGVTYYNQWGLKFTGRSLAEIQGDGWVNYIHPDHRQRIHNAWLVAVRDTSNYEVEIPFRRADGVYRWLDTRALPIIDDSGAVVYWIGVALDISDRKQAEADLRQKNAILDMVNESAPTPIFVKDRQNRIIYANPATLEVLGKSAEEVIGYRDSEIYPNLEDAARVMENDQRIMASGQIEVVEESPDGIRIFLGMKAPYRNEAGDVIGLIGISNDITERVQLEREREQILQREQAAREVAEQANRIKDEFLAVLSHELRTPLNPILGWASLLRQGKLKPEKVTNALEVIDRNAKLQVQLIDDLLDISRILRGKLILNKVPVDLNSTIQSALETVRLAMEAKAIVLNTLLDPKIGPVLGDMGRLQQVVWNLLSNAIKFTPQEGQITIVLTQAETQAEIQIQDTGKGIAPDFLPYVFEHFRQEDAATTRKFGGLGLGLAIARQIVELHGGSIAVSSQGESQGATFTVKLPLMRQQHHVETFDLTAISPESTHSLTGLRILVVDDDRDALELAKFVLEQAGAVVTSASSGLEALQAIQQSIPDLMVSDIGMPDMDGYMLMRQVAHLNPSRALPAIALTAYVGELDQQQAIAAGFQQHLAKPIEPDTLVKVVQSLVLMIQ